MKIKNIKENTKKNTEKKTNNKKKVPIEIQGRKQRKTQRIQKEVL